MKEENKINLIFYFIGIWWEFGVTYLENQQKNAYNSC
jgi:hypothetical protein